MKKILFIYTTEINKLEDFEFKESVVNEKNALIKKFFGYPKNAYPLHLIN